MKDSLEIKKRGKKWKVYHNGSEIKNVIDFAVDITQHKGTVTLVVGIGASDLEILLDHGDTFLREDE